MKIKMLTVLVLAAGCLIALAQTNQPADDWKAAPSNMPGQQFPQVNSEGRVRARLQAPQALDVQLNISGIKFPMTKDTNEQAKEYATQAILIIGFSKTLFCGTGENECQMSFCRKPNLNALYLKFRLNYY